MRLHICRSLACVTAILLLAGGVGAQRSSTPQAELRLAMDKASVDGDLAGAIALYKAIVQKYQKTDRATAAAALMQMADCYQKLGDSQARGAYERVTREFADVSEVAAAAKSRLAALATGAGAARSGALAIRRIYDGPAVEWCNGVSSDARYLSHPDWFTGNIAVADTTTGDVRRVTSTGSISVVTAQSGEFGECTIFSPDDKQIAFYWNATDDGQELRTVGMDGSKPRVVYRDADGRYLQPLDWSPDGRQILTLLYLRGGARHIASISVADGTARVLKAIESGGARASFSPDGRAIAYSARTSADSLKNDVFLMMSDGSRETALVKHAADDEVLGWSPDGTSVFFASDRTGSYGVWSIAVENGQPRGAPLLVKADLGAITPIRLVNGTLYYSVNLQISDVHVASIDPETGKGLSAAVPAKAESSGSHAKPDWSPDGKSLAYLSFRGTSGYPASPELVSILDLSTGVERHLRPALERLEPYGSGPVWSPDGRSLLVIAQQQTPQHGYYRVDVQTGATTELVKAARGQHLLHAIWSRDGRSIFYTIGSPTRIVRRDLTTGQNIDLVSLPNPAGVPKIALSPDGQWLAFTAREGAAKPVATVSVVPAAGGAVRPIYRAAEGHTTGFVQWTPDGRSVMFVQSIAADGAGRTRKRELWRASPDGGTIEKVDLDISGMTGWFSFSPDGRRIAFTVDKSKSEFWAIENLVSARNAPGGVKR